MKLLCVLLMLCLWAVLAMAVAAVACREKGGIYIAQANVCLAPGAVLP